MRFVIIDSQGVREKLSPAWLERDRAQAIADELNAELGTNHFVVVPLDEEDASWAA